MGHAGITVPESIPIDDIRIITNVANTSCADDCTLHEAAAAGHTGSELWRYDSTTNQYEDKQVAGSVDPLEGFWLKTEDNAYKSVPDLLVPNAEDAADPLEGELQTVPVSAENSPIQGQAGVMFKVDSMTSL